jgi:dynein light intermediate chain 1
VTLFSPPQQGAGGSSLLGGEAEEVVRVECHCFAGAAEVGYEETLRRVLVPRKVVEDAGKGGEEAEDTMLEGVNGEEAEGRRPSIAILMSWQRPWEFLDTLRKWFALLSRALLPVEAPKDENPLEVLKEYGISLSVVLQHVEAQEDLERENYKDDTFDYISQCLRTCLLPLSAGLVYTPSAPPPTQPGAPLNEVQKVIYASLGLDIAALQPRTGARPGSSSGTQQKAREELQPKHNVVDRMAIVVPSGWDSIGKIRLLSETFSPEALMEGWHADLSQVASLFQPLQPIPELLPAATNQGNVAVTGDVLQATAGAQEMYSSQPSPTLSSPTDGEGPLSLSKLLKSAIAPYEQAIQDPNAHKAPKPPQLEVTTIPEQDFLSEMRTQLQQFEAQDTERQRREPGGVHTTAGALQLQQSRDSSAAGGSALSDLGDVSFNVGGVSYNTVSAEAAIERLKRPQHPSSSSGGGEASPTVSTPRTGTPRPPKREGREETPGTGMKGELQTEKLEEYFASLMRRGGGGSASSTPSKPPTS